MICGATVLLASGNWVMWPSFLSILSRAAGERYQGSVQGFASSVGGFACILGLIPGRVLYEIFNQALFITAAVIDVATLISVRLLRLGK